MFNCWQVDYGRKASHTRFGTLFYGQYDSIEATAVVFPAPDESSSTLGYRIDDIGIYNLKQAADMCSDRKGVHFPCADAFTKLNATCVHSGELV